MSKRKFEVISKESQSTDVAPKTEWDLYILLTGIKRKYCNPSNAGAEI